MPKAQLPGLMSLEMSTFASRTSTQLASMKHIFDTTFWTLIDPREPKFTYYSSKAILGGPHHLIFVALNNNTISLLPDCQQISCMTKPMCV